jgi:uncharacterized damage-inducible protein DinB
MSTHPVAGARATNLERRLDAAAASLIAVLERMDAQRWSVVPAPAVWSIGKEAAHVAEAAVYHQWIVRLTIGEKVSSRRPAIERKEMTTRRAPHEIVELIHRRTEDGERLLAGLTDEQLSLPTRPPRARGALLAETIEGVLIGHYDGHREVIEAKLRALA